MSHDYAKRRTLPLGAVKAEGFLKEQLERSRDGMGGHLPEIEPGMIADPYIRKTYVKRWGAHDQSGWGAEISGNYYAGMIQLAFTLDDEGLKRKAEEWVDALLEKQREDGYLGTYTEPDAPIYDDYNAWGTACGMRALLFYYEATGRRDVFDAVYRCMLWFADKWAGERKTCYAGSLIMEPVLYCYRETGDERLLRFAEDYSDFLEKHTMFRNSYRDFLDPKLHYNSNHTAAYGVSVRLPALLYAATGKGIYLDASENGVKKLMERGVQLSGGPVSVSEYVGPVGAVNETEYCSFAFFNSSYIALGAVTGKSVYGDYMEQMVYNGAQGAKKKDERAIAYLSAPNQIFATVNSSSAVRDMQIYAPCYPVSCCPVNSVAVVPEFVRGMASTDAEGNLYLNAYGPCSISFGGWSVEETTLYPFRHEITLDIAHTGPGRLFCRIPVWARGAKLTQNGVTRAAEADENGYFAVDGTGRAVLTFEADVEVVHVDDRDAAGKLPLAFRWGALLFALPIETVWKPFYPATETPLTKEWPWYSAEPVKPAVDCADAHERLGLVRDRFPWSAAVDEKLTADDVTLEFGGTDGYPWEKPFVKLRVPAYHAPFLCAPYAGRTFEPFGDRQEVTEPTELTHVPFGTTNLRISYFPRADV